MEKVGRTKELESWLHRVKQSNKSGKKEKQGREEAKVVSFLHDFLFLL